MNEKGEEMMTDLEMAVALGRKSFLTVKMRVPALDPECCEFMKGKQNLIQLLTAYLTAWDKENLTMLVCKKTPL